MKTHLLATVLLVSAPQPASEKPTQGRVRIHLSADSSESYKGVQQRSSELEETTRDVRRNLNNNKWLELTENAEEADIRLLVLGRRKDVERGLVLGYSLEAGAFNTKD